MPEKRRIYAVAADPEVVVVDASGKPVPCVGILPGSKEEPFSNELGEIMEDNVLAEFTVNPTNDEDVFVDQLASQLGNLKDMLAENNLGISIVGSVNYEEDQLQSAQAKKAGCDPDYDAWIPAVNDTVELGDTTLRSAAGHIHMDLPNMDADPLSRVKATKACDLLIGVPLCLISNDLDRRKLYGKAGAHRPKPYGIEYRVPDNSWIKDEALQRWVFRQVQMIANNYAHYAYHADRYKGEILAAINLDDMHAARELYEVFIDDVNPLPRHLELRA